MDVGFWVMYLGIGLPMFGIGYWFRGQVEQARAERNRRDEDWSKLLHPSRRGMPRGGWTGGQR